MTVILDGTSYEDIRSLLGTNFREFPDAIITSSGITPLINAYLQTVVPDFSLLSGNDVIFAKAAASYMAAAFCVDILAIKRSQQIKIGDYSESNSKGIDFEKWRNNLLASANTALYSITSVKAQLILSKRKIFVTGGPISSKVYPPNDFVEWYKQVSPRINNWFMNLI